MKRTIAIATVRDVGVFISIVGTAGECETGWMTGARKSRTQGAPSNLYAQFTQNAFFNGL